MANKRFDHAPKFVVKDDAVVIQQAVGSSAPLLDVKDHTGSSLMSINSAGAMTGASLTSPALTGTPTAPTATAGTNTTQVATTEFVRTEISNLVASAPAALDTLDELAAALGDDANFATTVTNALAAKAPLDSPTFTGTVTLPADSVTLGTTTTGNYVASLVAGTGISLANNTGESATPTITNTGVTGLTGTANQITVSASTGSVTLSIPSSPTLSGTVTAGGFSAVGTMTLNRAGATAWNAGANINLKIDGITYSTIGVNANSRVQFSGGLDIASVSYVNAGNNSYIQFGPNSTWGAYLRVGSTPNVSGTSIAQVISTDGNLHLDSGANNNIYLNYYSSGRPVNIYGAVSTTSYMSIGTVYNGPHSNGGGILRMRSGNEGSWLWDGTFRFYVDNSNVKNFTIQHPTKPDNYLVHACSEGPTSDVFYRGTGQLEKGIAVIQLPDYFEDLAEIEGRTVMITPIADETGVVANLAAYEIHNGSFVVEQIGGYVVPNQRFWWRVDAVRKNTSFPVEPLKSSVNVGGFGPYTFIDEV